MNRIGIDIGSTTVKIAILDEENNIIFSAYERHFANIQENLAIATFFRSLPVPVVLPYPNI